MKFSGKIYAVGHMPVSSASGGEITAPMVTLRAELSGGGVAFLQIPATAKEAAALAHHLYGEVKVDIAFTTVNVVPEDGAKQNVADLARAAEAMLGYMQSSKEATK